MSDAIIRTFTDGSDVKVLRVDGETGTQIATSDDCCHQKVCCGQTCEARNLDELSTITVTFELAANASSGHCSVSLNRTISHIWTRIDHIFPSGGETISADEFVFYQEPNEFVLPELSCLRTLRFRVFNGIGSGLNDPDISACSPSDMPPEDNPDGPSLEGSMDFTFSFISLTDSCAPGGGFSGELTFVTSCGFVKEGDVVGCGHAQSIFSDPFHSPPLNLSASFDTFASSLAQTFVFSLSDSGTDTNGPWDYTATVTVDFA